MLLVTVFLVAAAPRVLETSQTRVLRQTLAAASPVDQTITASTGWVVFPNGHGPADRPSPVQLAVTTALLSRGLPAPLTSARGSGGPASPPRAARC